MKGLLYLLPWLIGFAILQLYPFITSFIYSFSDYTVGGKLNFIGLGNYIKLFTKDKDFWNSLKVTLLFGLYVVPARSFWLCSLPCFSTGTSAASALCARSTTSPLCLEDLLRSHSCGA